MKFIQILTISVSLMTLPVSPCLSAISDPTAAYDDALSLQGDSIITEELGDLQFKPIEINDDGTPPELSAAIINFLLSGGNLGKEFGLTDDFELIGSEDILEIQMDKGFWTKEKILVGSGLLLTLSLLLGIFAFAGSGGGSSSGSNSGSGSGGGDGSGSGGGNGGPDPGFASGSGSGGSGGGSEEPSSSDSGRDTGRAAGGAILGAGAIAGGSGFLGGAANIPHHPEPTTFLLLGLGLLFPFLRRRGGS